MNDRFRARRDAFLRKIASPPVIMGILNLTPDSFSDGGEFSSVAAATAHANKMVADGCDIVDVGGESTRPGARPISDEEEWTRVEPVLAELMRQGAVPISIDTYKASVAARALELGAVVVNDVWGLQKDPAMPKVVAEAGAVVVIMHNRNEKDESVDVIDDIRRFFDRSLALAAAAGIAREHVVLDPGIGFGKTSAQNRDALRRLPELKDYGLPLLVGLSRKGFLGSLSNGGGERTLAGTVAASLAAAANGASIFRVHDVAAHVAALNVFYSLRSVR
jgi:dihydropteroate synthase